MAAGAAYCEHAHAVLLSRFRKVAEELDKNTHAAEVAEVQHRLERIVEVNHVIRERVNKASEVRKHCMHACLSLPSHMNSSSPTSPSASLSFQ